MTCDRLLPASDGPDASEAVLEHAVRLADESGSALHIGYVLDVGEHPRDVEDAGEHPELKAERERGLQTAAEKAEAAGLDVTSVAVRSRTTSVTLLAYAGDHDVDRIVTGTHGRSGLERVVQDSAAEALVRDAPVPVVTVRPDAAEDDTMEGSV